jgi:hypothetical protein
MAPSTAFERRMDSHARRPLIAFLFVAWNSARSITPFIGATSACIGNALFADGAGAVVLGSTAKGADDARRWWLAATASCVFPNTANAMTWSIGNHGFEMTISTELPRLTQENLSGWLTAWLERQGARGQRCQPVGRSSGRTENRRGGGGGYGVDHRTDGDFARRAIGLRQHVVGDGAIYPGVAVQTRGTAAMRHARFRTGASGRGCTIRLGLSPALFVDLFPLLLS